MIILLTAIYIVVCLFLIIVVLLQSGKAADLAGAFGGMGSQTAFGPRGAANALSRATTAAAALFMILSIALSIVATRTRGGEATVLDSQKTTQTDGKSANPAGGKTPTMTITPEGGDPSESVTVPIPLPEETGQGGAKVRLPLPGQPAPAAPKPEQKK